MLNLHNPLLIWGNKAIFFFHEKPPQEDMNIISSMEKLRLCFLATVSVIDVVNYAVISFQLLASALLLLLL